MESRLTRLRVVRSVNPCRSPSAEEKRKRRIAISRRVHRSSEFTRVNDTARSVLAAVSLETRSRIRGFSHDKIKVTRYLAKVSKDRYNFLRRAF